MLRIIVGPREKLLASKPLRLLKKEQPRPWTLSIMDGVEAELGVQAKLEVRIKSQDKQNSNKSVIIKMLDCQMTTLCTELLHLRAAVADRGVPVEGAVRQARLRPPEHTRQGPNSRRVAQVVAQVVDKASSSMVEVVVVGVVEEESTVLPVVATEGAADQRRKHKGARKRFAQ